MDGFSGKDEQKTVILMLGRNSFDDVIEAVARAGEKGVTVITYFIGDQKPDVDPMKMSNIVHGFVPVRRSYDLWHSEYELLELVCKKHEVPTTPSPPLPLPPTTKPCRTDVVIVIDDVLLHKVQGVKYLRSFLKQLSNSLVFGEDGASVGLLRFGRKNKDMLGGMTSERESFQAQVPAKISRKAATGPASFNDAVKEANKMLTSNGRNSDEVNKLVVFVMARRPRKLMQTSMLRKWKSEGLMISSVATHDASSIPPELMTNMNKESSYHNAIRYLGF